MYVIKKQNGRRHSADYENLADSEDPHTISDPELKQLYNSKKRHSHIIKVKRRESNTGSEVRMSFEESQDRDKNKESPNSCTSPQLKFDLSSPSTFKSSELEAN